MTSPLRIALLTHSTNPRGGVAHALALGEALHDRGHRVTVIAADESGRGFPRRVRCDTRVIRVERSTLPLADRVEQRAAAYVAHLQTHLDEFDVYHAQDSISGNALATLKSRGLIGGFVRTVHHLDDFADHRLRNLQDRAVHSARRIICVSNRWARQVRQTYLKEVNVVPNGVDLSTFNPVHTAHDDSLRTQYDLDGGPVFLSIGGIEERKNSVNILRAFIAFHSAHPLARLVLVGGATLLDHGGYQQQFEAVISAANESAQRAVLRLGVVADERIPALMRRADALLFPSVKEGFGLVVLEAMACGTPTVASRIEPFTEYLGTDDTAWCDPADVASIMAAMARVLCEADRLRQRGFLVAARFPWRAAAESHETVYRTFLKENDRAGNEIQNSVAR